MTTYDLAEVRGSTADIHARMNRRDNGEGSVGAASDADLRPHAELCASSAIRFANGDWPSSPVEWNLTSKSRTC